MRMAFFNISSEIVGKKGRSPILKVPEDEGTGAFATEAGGELYETLGFYEHVSFFMSYCGKLR